VQKLGNVSNLQHRLSVTLDTVGGIFAPRFVDFQAQYAILIHLIQ